MGGDNGWFVPPSQRYGNGPPPPQNGYGHNDYAPPPGPPPGYQGGHNGGGGGGYAPPGGFRPPPPGDYGRNNGYGQPPPHHNGGYHGGPPPPQGYGHQQQQQQHYPPQQHRPPPGHHGGPPPGNYGPPRPQQQLQGGGGGGAAPDNKPWVPPKIGVTRLTRMSWLWTTFNHDGETCCEIGPVSKGEPYYSCKFGMSGRTKLKTGPYDQDGPLVGEVAVKGTFIGKYLPTFNGFQTELKNKGYSLTGSVKVYAFEIPINGRKEIFEWKPHDKSMTARLTDQKGWQLNRKGMPEDAPPLVIYKDQEGNGFTSKTKMGTVEFVGQGATGELGDMFPNLVILTLLNIRQQRHVENAAASAGGV